MDLFAQGQAEQPAVAAPVPPVTYVRKALRGLWTIGDLERVLPLRQLESRMYGKVFAAPRLECWHGDRPYSFGGRTVMPDPWPSALVSLRKAVEGHVTNMVGYPVTFDSCFANLYRNGQDFIDWHADDEAWIGEPIASVTFGGARLFELRHNETKHKVSYVLGDGDLLVMHTGTQAAWKHRVPRTVVKVERRLNLTFRRTVR